MFAFKFIDRFTIKHTLCQGPNYIPHGTVQPNEIFKNALLLPNRMSMSWDSLPDDVMQAVRSKKYLTKAQMNIVCAFLDEKESEYNDMYGKIVLPESSFVGDEVGRLKDISVHRVYVQNHTVYCCSINIGGQFKIKFKDAPFKPIEMLLEKVRNEIKSATDSKCSDTESEEEDDGEEKMLPFHEKLHAYMNDAFALNNFEGSVYIGTDNDENKK